MGSLSSFSSWSIACLSPTLDDGADTHRLHIKGRRSLLCRVLLWNSSQRVSANNNNVTLLVVFFGGPPRRATD